MVISRRNVVKSSLIAAAGGISSEALTTTNKKYSGKNYHLDIADIAKQIGKNSTVTVLIPKGSEPNVSAIIRMFTKSTGIKVKLKIAPVDDINTQMHLSSRVSQSDYDLALPATFGIPDLVESNLIVDLSDLHNKYFPSELKKSSLYNIGDYYKNKFYGYQTDGDAYLMFYNSSLVKKNGIASFEDKLGKKYQLPETWEELDSQMEFYHNPKNNQFGGVLFRNSTYLAWEFWSRFHSKGHLPLGDDLTPNINNDAGIETLEQMIRSTDHLHPSAHTNGLVENWSQFSKGNIYANIGWGGTQKFLMSNNSIIKNNLSYSPLPGGRKGDLFYNGSYFNWGWNYTVPKHSKNRPLSYLFSLFAISPGPSTQAIQQSAGFLDPFRSEHYSDKVIQDIYSVDFLSAHFKAMNNCIPDFYMHGQNLYFHELRKFLRFALERKMSAKMALETVAKSWESIHVKLGADKQLSQWRFLKSQYSSPQKIGSKNDHL